MSRLYNGVRVTNAPSPDNVMRLDRGIVPMILAMQQRGLLIDTEHFKKFGADMRQRCEEITEEITDLTGKRINVGSADQVWGMVKGLGIKVPRSVKMTASGDRPSMDDAALEAISPDHPAIPLVQEYRECAKLDNTYAEVVPRLAVNGRLHPNLILTQQLTGRISAKKPNLLAMPKRSDLGRKIRYGFVAGKGNKIISCDFSQIEMRIIAHQGKVKKMIDIFHEKKDPENPEKGDIHYHTAMDMFRRAAKELNKLIHRLPAKNTGFGVVYDISGKGLLIQMIKSGAQKAAIEAGDPWTLEKCEEMIRDWYALYPEVLEHRSLQHSRARRYGMVWDAFGRIRLVPEVKSVHRWIQAEGLRGAGNHTVQGSACGLLKLSMAQIWDQICVPFNDMIWPMLPVHDEIILTCVEEAAEDFAAWIADIMRNVMQLIVPIEVGVSIGDSWGETSN